MIGGLDSWKRDGYAMEHRSRHSDKTSSSVSVGDGPNQPGTTATARLVSVGQDARSGWL